MSSGELLPANLWGLDPLFRSHVKLYIKDVVSLQEIEGHQGIFLYRWHPVVRVDIQGVIVKVEERDRFFIYSLDDGTGVINCTHWKRKESHKSSKPLSESMACNLSKKLKEAHAQKDCLDEGYALGNLVNVRGKLRTFRGRTEVMASCCIHLTDPNKETERMMLLPILYKKCYNKPVTLPKAFDMLTPGENVVSSLELEESILNIINQLERFTAYDLVTNDRIKVFLNETQQGNTALTEALVSLEESGHIFKNTALEDQSAFYVSCQCTHLKDTIIKIIKQWIQEHGNEDGCPDWHIYGQIKKTLQFQGIKKTVLGHCLASMESTSSIISTAENEYIVFDN